MKGLLFTIGLTAFGAIAGLFYPFWGMLAYIVISTLHPPTLWFWSVPFWRYARLVGVCSLVGWALTGFGNWNFGRSGIPLLFLVGYVFFMLLSAVNAPYQEIAWAYVQLQVKIVLGVIAAYTLIDSLPKIRILAWAMALCIGFVAYEANLDYYQGGLRLKLGTGFPFMFLDNNGSSTLMAAASALTFFLALTQKNLFVKFGLFAVAAMMIHAPMIAESRGGMLTAIAVGVTTAIVIPKTKQNVVYVLLGLVVALSLAGPPVIQRFNTIFVPPEERDGSAASRIELWKIAIHEMFQHPVTGIGPGHFRLIADEYGFPEGKASHTTWLNAGAELGIGGMICLVGFFAYIAWHSLRIAYDSRWRKHEIGHLAAMVFVFLTSYAVGAQFVTLDRLEAPFFIALIGAGLLRVTDRMRRQLEETAPLTDEPSAMEARRIPQAA